MKNFADELERIAIQVDIELACSDSAFDNLNDAAAYLRLLADLRHETREVMRGRSKNCEKVRELLAQIEAFENKIELKEAGLDLIPVELVEYKLDEAEHEKRFKEVLDEVLQERRDVKVEEKPVESFLDWYGGI